MRTRRTRALLFVCAVAAGCTSSGSEDAGAELGTGASSSSGAGSLALVRLERLAPDETEPPRVVANARVARYTGVDASAVLKLLGADVRDGESCTLASRLDDFAMAPEARVELLSVGEIGLRMGELSHTLSPRLFPDLTPTASGWFYGTKAELPLPRSEGDEYVLSAQGEQGVGRFELSVAAPGEVSQVELGGTAVERDAVLARRGDVELTWEPEDMRDRLELEVVAAGAVLSCSVRDDGQFTLGQGKLASLEPDAHASLVLRRVRVVSTEMQGIDSAYVRLATTRTLPIRVE